MKHTILWRQHSELVPSLLFVFFLCFSFHAREWSWCVICLMSLLFWYNRCFSMRMWCLAASARYRNAMYGMKRKVILALATRQQNRVRAHTTTTWSKRNVRGRGNHHTVNKKKVPFVQSHTENQSVELIFSPFDFFLSLFLFFPSLSRSLSFSCVHQCTEAKY